MKQVKRCIYTCAVAVIVTLAIMLFFTVKSKSNIEKKLKNAVECIKSYDEQFSNSENKNRAFKLTTEQLKSSKDSIFQELNETRAKLKVKESKLRSLQYVSSVFTKTDTIKVPDTIFIGKDTDIDTVVSDEWYSVRVGLKYPSTVIIRPEFKSIKHIVVSTRKETINPPKKFFLFRWFQKRHTVLNVDVIEKNPYIQNQNSRFVEIVK